MIPGGNTGGLIINMEVTKKCALCKQDFPLSTFAPRNDGTTYRISYCVPCLHARDKKWREQDRRKTLDKYGGKCECCGETEFRFLAIDHINGGGHKHQQEVGQGFKFYRWLRQNNFPYGFRVLCHNCNFGRYLNGGVCPHKTSHVSSR